MRLRWILGLAALVAATSASAAEPAPPLALEATIVLPGVSGRIDHLAVDLARRRLFVAELGSDGVGVVDLGAGRPVARLSGLREPRAVALAPRAERIVVTTGGGRALRTFRADDMMPAADVSLGADADNLHVLDDGRVVVGSGAGRLAVLDAHTLAVSLDVPLPAHPEGFAVDSEGQRAYVNLPDAHAIARVDLASRRIEASWSVPGVRANFPLALAADGARVVSVFRTPPTLVVLDAASGAVRATAPTCGDADDVFLDARRSRIYVSCGEGTVDALQLEPDGDVRPLGRVPTARGARTSLWVPALDRLFVAARASGDGADARLLELRPTP